MATNHGHRAVLADPLHAGHRVIVEEMRAAGLDMGFFVFLVEQTSVYGGRSSGSPPS